MAQAGQELACALGNILGGPIYSIPRSMLLEPLYNADREELEDA